MVRAWPSHGNETFVYPFIVRLRGDERRSGTGSWSDRRHGDWLTTLALYTAQRVGVATQMLCEGGPPMGTLKAKIKEFEQEHELRDDIAAELTYDPSIVADNIEVSTAEGVVTLEGQVDSLAQRWAVERAVRRVAGVTAVNNDLVVLPPRNLSRTDAEIADAVKTVLAWTANLPGGISCSVENGWVTLEGAVGFRFQKHAAENAVRRLIGVRGVSNDIVVATAEAAQDIKQAIGNAIRRRVDHPVDIEVAFDDGTVTLRGTAHSWAERREAEESAQLAAGVRTVIDEVRVQP